MGIVKYVVVAGYESTSVFPESEFSPEFEGDGLWGTFTSEEEAKEYAYELNYSGLI